MKENELLIWLQNWYAAQCDGEWEHGYGIQIDTIDNPGWLIKINIQGTFLKDKEFQRKKIERSEYDWVQYWVKDSIFQAAGGAKNLFEIIEIFKKWVDDGVI